MGDPFKRPTKFTNKRKLNSQPSPDEIYKSVKHSANGDAKGHEHHSDGASNHDEEAAGPQPPPEDDEEVELDDDDEEGRFFGGGVSEDTTQAMDYIEEHDKDQDEVAPEVIDSAWLRKLSLNFERRISRNAELRAKYEDNPEKFMGSEADLDADIKTLSSLSEHPELYEEFAKLGCVGSLVSLLAHENTDIAIDAIEILAELTDQDVQAEQEQWDVLVNAALESDLPNLLIQNFDRLDEVNESDRNGVYHSLSLLENLASQTKMAEKLVEDSPLLKWLLQRMQRKESPVSQNKQYAAEVFAIVLQVAEKARLSAIGLDAVDSALQTLSAYRKRDPNKNSDEEEYVENVFDGLTSLVEMGQGKQKFVEAEGAELCLIMLKEGKFSKFRALRVLDHATSGQAGVQVCERVVEAAGLKPLFSVFMKSTERQITEHVLGIFASMLRLLPGSSSPRIRLLAKFMEKDYEKVVRLLKLRREYGARLSKVDQEIASEREDLTQNGPAEREDEWLSRRLDSGLFSFQTIDIMLAWLIAEDDGARDSVVEALGEIGESLEAIGITLQEQLAGLRLEKEDTEGTMTADMLHTLLSYVT